MDAPKAVPWVVRIYLNSYSVEGLAVGNSQAGKSAAYKSAGVDIDLATSLLQKVKGTISATRRAEVLAPIGGFGGLFRIDLRKWRHPVLVTSIDGVGTKLIVAAEMEQYRGVGHDIVNHCINDIAVQGAEPVYFLDYIGIGKLRSPLYEEVLTGIAEACLAQNVTLIGGETAEMPGMYGQDFDLVGCITGIVEEEKIISGDGIRPGYQALGLASNGLHTNGFSLARKVLFEKAGLGVRDCPEILGGQSVGEALLVPHRCYWPAIKQAMEEELPLAGIAHITGGGLYDNVPRILPDGVSVRFKATAIPTVPPIFSLIRSVGEIDEHELYRVFNMGVGMVWFVPPEAVAAALSLCRSHDLAAAVIGEVLSGDKQVEIEL
ncbi:MAG: phosphoribosylformylglycinamidine cyclo-ligase [Lentisphaerae bacterium]|nr:phosphoribosylformylglycinamidine cyclo-ligase [Lentisphaerota bacterium]